MGGFWQIDTVEPPRYLELRDGFADPDGTRNDQLALAGATLAVRDAGIDAGADYEPERGALFADR